LQAASSALALTAIALNHQSVDDDVGDGGANSAHEKVKRNLKLSFAVLGHANPAESAKKTTESEVWLATGA
jgi:hypothetical protein